MKGPRIHAVAGSGDAEALRRLLDSGVEVDFRDQTKATPLMIASAAGKLASVKVLVERGADVDAADRDGETALHFVARHHYPEVLAALLAAGASANLVDARYGNTPLHLAVSNAMPGLTEMVELLLRAGANRSIPN